MVNESVPFEIRKFLDNNDYLINEDWSKEPVLKISITVSKDYKPLQVKSAPFRQDLKIEAKVILRENIEKNFIKKVDVVTPDLEISKCMMVKQEGKNSSLVLIPKNVNKFIECGKKKIFSLKQLLSNAGNKIFTSLDVKSAYNLIGLNEDSKKFCCFSTEEGVYQAERLQLGFKDAPFHFIEAIEHLLEGIDFTGWFMDDIIIYAPSQIHNEIILKVLGRLASVNFKLSLNKCKFRQISVDFIGYDLKADGAAIPYSKKEKLSNTRSPRTLKEIKSIFSSLSFYRSLIPRYTELTEDFCNKKTFTWKKQDEKNFREILVLIEDKTKLSFIIGGTLSFRLCMSFGKRSFSFAFYYGEALFTLGGRVLNRSEINYSQTSLYALCIKEALFENAWIINAAVIKVEVSDCDIRKLLSHPPKMNEINNHVMRHIIPLECFNIAYVSVSEFNIFNDMRVEILDTKELKQTANKLCAINEQENSYLIDDSVEIKKAYGIDSISKIMLKSIEEPLTQQEILLLPKCIGKQKILLSEKGLLLIGLKKKIWIPEDLEETILEKLHQVHSNDTAMIKLANATIVFKDWTTKIKRKYAHCKRCQLFRRAGRFNFSSWPESTSVLERVHMDHAQIGNKYILLFVDSFSNHLTLKICKNMVTETLCKQFIEYVNEAGIPSLVVSDQYPVFLSASFQKLLEELNCLQMFATPYNSFTNGEVEEYVQFSKSQLAKFTEDGVKLEDAIAKTILENRLTVAKNGRTVIQNYFNDTRSSIEHIFAKYKPDFQEINEKCLYKHKLADQKWLEAVCHYRIGNQAFIVEDNQGKFHLRKPNCISINNTIKGADVSETTKLDEEARTEMFKKVYLLTALTAEQEESKAIESSGC
uniref:Reverse transcriptase domain-containing protein n=1 Tax=Rhabditophanes sp. KR3021 TaxID=114890 RepID=A0AC35TT65_9BILA